MPLVVVQYNPNCVPEHVLMSIIKALPESVADALHLEKKRGAHLSPGEVEVRAQKVGQYDMNTTDLAISIWANDFPERRASLEMRRRQIAEGVRRVLADYSLNIRGYVWLMLHDAAYGRI